MRIRKLYAIKGIIVALVVSAFFSFTIPTFGGDRNADIGSVFEEKYETWKEWVKEHPYMSTYTANQPFVEIIELGPSALPYIVEKIQKNPDDFHLGYVVARISKKHFEKEDWPKGKLGDAITAASLYVNWWKKDRYETHKRFEKLYKEWKLFKAEGKGEAEKKYQKIINLGICVLPYLVEKLKENNSDLIPAISELTDGDVNKEFGVSDCVDWWKKNKDKLVVPCE